MLGPDLETMTEVFVELGDKYYKEYDIDPKLYPIVGRALLNDRRNRSKRRRQKKDGDLRHGRNASTLGSKGASYCQLMSDSFLCSAVKAAGKDSCDIEKKCDLMG